MAHKELTAKQVTSLLAIKAKQERHTVWFGLTEKLAIREAVLRGTSTVTLKNREFTIEHRAYFGGSVLVNPTAGFVPCGYFTYKRLGIQTTDG